ncbi:hypothetical protein LXL04_037391 [Taraxacum kok-saghyz]
MMAIKLFVCIFLGVLICTSDIACGRNHVRKEEISLAHGEGTSKIGCSTGEITCGEGHDYNRKESLKQYIGRTFVNKNGYQNLETNDVVSVDRNNSDFTNSRRNGNDKNANRNNLGNDSGSGNVIKGKVSQDGNETVNGAGSGNAVVSAVGFNSAKGVNDFNYNEVSPAP